jgi:lipoprotein
MKKLSFAMSAMACAALVLSGCGNSVSDDRAEAYASLSSMTSLSTSRAQEYKQRLTVAPDSAAIKSVLAEAKAANEKSQADKAAAAAKEAADDKIVKKTEATLSGVTLVGLSDACKGVTLTLKADKTWDIKIDRTLNNCINPTGETWKVIVEEDRYGNKPVLRFSRDDRSYVLTLNGDGTVSINNSAKFTITK